MPPVLHYCLSSASEWVPAMDRVTEMVEAANITGAEATAVFPLAVRYSNWETDKVIGRELYQNLISSLLAIFLTVLVFLGSLRASCIVIFCVGATILEVDLLSVLLDKHCISMSRLRASCISGV